MVAGGNFLRKIIPDQGHYYYDQKDEFTARYHSEESFRQYLKLNFKEVEVKDD